MSHSLASIAVYKRIAEDYRIAYTILSRHLGARHSLMLDLHAILCGAEREHDEAVKEHEKDEQILHPNLR